MPDGNILSEITITFFDNYGATTKTERRVAWKTLQDMILTTIRSRKDELPWLKLARFGDKRSDKGSLRHDTNVQAISGIELDYDGEELGWHHAVDLLAHFGIRAVVYTSPSNTAQKPRWRILCPTSRELAPGERRRLVDRVAGIFGDIFATESWTLSQAYFYGAVDGNPDHHVELVEGMPIDLADHLDSASTRGPQTESQQRSGSSGRAPFDEGELLSQIVSGASMHMAKVRLAGRWARDGIAYMVARQRLVDAFDLVPETQRDDRWRNRFDDIDRCVEDIYGKQTAQADEETSPPGSANDATPNAPPAGQMVIRYRPGQIAKVVDQAEQALIVSDAGIYQRGTLLVRVGKVGVTVRDGHDVMALRIMEVGEHALVEALTRTAEWQKFDGRSQKWIPADAPLKVATTYLQRVGLWQQPVLAGIIDAPTLRPDGSVLDTPGYDRSTGLLLIKGETDFPAVPDAPTQFEAVCALGVLEELLSGFPFIDRASKAVALSCIVSACVRRSLPTGPLHAFTAPAPGSGKSFLVDVACLIASDVKQRSWRRVALPRNLRSASGR